MTAYTGGAMNVNAWAYPVVVDLSGLDVGNSSRPILLNHRNDDLDFVLGQTEDITVTQDSLEVAGSVFSSGAMAQRVMEMNDAGFKFQASVGVRPTNVEFVEQGSTAKANGQEFSGPVYITRAGVLSEISFVVLGADDQTSARIAANAAKETVMTFEQWLKAKGFDVAGLSDAQKASLQAMFDTERGITASGATQNSAPVQGNGKPAASGDLDTVLTASRQQQEKRQKIVDLTAQALQDHPNHLQMIEALSRQAIDGGWDTQRYELELLRATRPQATNIIARSGNDGLTSDVVEAAICLSANIEAPEKHFGEPVLEAASKRWRHGLGLGEVLMLFAKRNGYDALSTRNIGPMLKAAFAEPRQMILASGPSSVTLPGILSNVANKFLRMGFDSVESTWRSIAAIRSVRDFKQVSSYSLTGDFEYKEIPGGGKLEHASPGEETYTNQAKSYGRLFAVDRRDIINDDLGALTQVPKRLGRGGALKFNNVFWTAFLDNSSFFTTGNANYLEGATAGTNDTRMNIEGLTRAETLFFDQTDPDSKPLGVLPKVLLVPNALNATASALMNSTEIRDTTASTKYPTSNPHAGKFTLVRSSYLSNASYTGYSAAAWYLLADPNDVAVIEAAFLNGVEAPYVESADADFDVLGIQMRGYHDFGVSKQEYRGGVKMKGAA